MAALWKLLFQLGSLLFQKLFPISLRASIARLCVCVWHHVIDFCFISYCKHAIRSGGYH